MGDFVRAIGEGVGGLVAGSLRAIGVAFDTIVATLSVWLPGPLLLIVALVIVLLVLRSVFRR